MAAAVKELAPCQGKRALKIPAIYFSNIQPRFHCSIYKLTSPIQRIGLSFDIGMSVYPFSFLTSRSKSRRKASTSSSLVAQLVQKRTALWVPSTLAW